MMWKGWKVGLITAMVLLLLASTANAVQNGDTFHRTNITVKALRNSTVTGTTINTPAGNFSICGVPIAINITSHNSSQNIWNITNSSNLIVYGYNNNYNSSTQQLNLSNSTWFFVNATSPGVYYINISNPNNASEYVNFTVVYWKVDEIKIGGQDVLNSPQTLQAGDYTIWVNVTMPTNNSAYNVTDVSVNASQLGLSSTVDLTGTCNVTGGYCNYTGTLQLHYNRSGVIKLNVTVGDPTLLREVVQTNTINVIPANPYKFLINTSIEGNTTTGNTIRFGLNVTDKYGNVNSTFSGTVNFTIVVLEGNATVNPYHGSMNSSQLNNLTVYLNKTSTNPTTVKVRVTGDWNGNTLVADEETFEFFNQVSGIKVDVNKTTLYANNRDTAKVVVQLVDANGNPVKVSGKSVTISNLVDSNHPNLGLKFKNNTGAWASTFTDTTNSNGQVTFYIKADNKSGTATVQVSAEGGLYKTFDITLKQAPNASGITNNSVTTIYAGKEVKVWLRMVDYNNTVIKNSADMGYVVEFNITSGDAIWKENNAKVYVTGTNDSGYAVATLYTTNATNNNIVVTIRWKNETGNWDPNTRTLNIRAVPNNVTDAKVYYSLDNVTFAEANYVALPNIKGKTIVIRVNLTDAYGNYNNTTSATMIVTTDNTNLGNMTNYSATVNNNLVVNINNGVGYFNYTVNTTESGTATLTLNITTFKIVKTLKITTTGPKSIIIEFNNTKPYVNSTINIVAWLADANGNKLAMNGVNLTFLIKLPNGTYISSYRPIPTNASGAANYSYTVPEKGLYTVTVSNATYGIKGTATLWVYGSAEKIVVDIVGNKIVAKVLDADNNVTKAIDGNTLQFFVDGLSVGTPTVVDGKANVTYNFTVGKHEIVVIGAGLQKAVTAITIGLKSGWNMVSVPLKIYNCTKLLWAISFENGNWGQWVTTKDLKPDKGYFVYSPSDMYVTFIGEPVTITTINLTAGWNLIPSPKTIDLSNYNVYDHAGWYWNGTGYEKVTTTEPYKAYWVYVGSNTTMVI